MPIIMKNTLAGRRAVAISQHDVDQMLADGTAKHCAPYGGLYEEVTEGEISQGYMTRNLAALPIATEPRKRGRPPKARSEAVAETPADEGAE